jgi:hypothetical protein
LCAIFILSTHTINSTNQPHLNSGQTKSNILTTSTNRPSNQPTNQLTNQPTNQPTNRPTNQPTNPPTNQPTNHPNYIKSTQANLDDAIDSAVFRAMAKRFGDSWANRMGEYAVTKFVGFNPEFKRTVMLLSY